MAETVEQSELQPKLLAAGDTALVVEYGAAVDPAINARVVALAEALSARKLEGIVDLVATFRSLMIHYDPLRLPHSALVSEVHKLLHVKGEAGQKGRLWVLPTLYGEEEGPDLEDVARETGHTPEEVIRLHSETEYTVYMMGFLPGLPYLGLLPEQLALPRRVEPRVRVPAGSVSIATNLANVYPSESPGGWHILGRTPIRLFDLKRDPPILLTSGDRIRFHPVDRETYGAFEERALQGDTGFEPEGEV